MESLPELVDKKQLRKDCWQQQGIFPGLITSRKLFPQHAVIKESSENMKIPPAFDSSVRDVQGNSLNWAKFNRADSESISSVQEASDCRYSRHSKGIIVNTCSTQELRVPMVSLVEGFRPERNDYFEALKSRFVVTQSQFLLGVTLLCHYGQSKS